MTTAEILIVLPTLEGKEIRVQQFDDLFILGTFQSLENYTYRVTRNYESGGRLAVEFTLNLIEDVFERSIFLR